MFFDIVSSLLFLDIISETWLIYLNLVTALFAKKLVTRQLDAVEWCNGIKRSVLCCLSLANVCSVIMHSDYTLIAFHELNKNFLMQVGLEKLSFKLFHSDLNLIITVWRRLELFSTHSFRHEVGIYFHQLLDSVLCLTCMYCNRLIDRKSVDLFSRKSQKIQLFSKL
jgi:hypothetical protein